MKPNLRIIKKVLTVFLLITSLTKYAQTIDSSDSQNEIETLRNSTDSLVLSNQYNTLLKKINDNENEKLAKIKGTLFLSSDYDRLIEQIRNECHPVSETIFVDLVNFQQSLQYIEKATVPIELQVQFYQNLSLAPFRLNAPYMPNNLYHPDARCLINQADVINKMFMKKYQYEGTVTNPIELLNWLEVSYFQSFYAQDAVEKSNANKQVTKLINTLEHVFNEETIKQYKPLFLARLELDIQSFAPDRDFWFNKAGSHLKNIPKNFCKKSWSKIKKKSTDNYNLAEMHGYVCFIPTPTYRFDTVFSRYSEKTKISAAAKNAIKALIEATKNLTNKD